MLLLLRFSTFLRLFCFVAYVFSNYETDGRTRTSYPRRPTMSACVIIHYLDGIVKKMQFQSCCTDVNVVHNEVRLRPSRCIWHGSHSEDPPNTIHPSIWPILKSNISLVVSLSLYTVTDRKLRLFGHILLLNFQLLYFCLVILMLTAHSGAVPKPTVEASWLKMRY